MLLKNTSKFLGRVSQVGVGVNQTKVIAGSFDVAQLSGALLFATFQYCILYILKICCLFRPTCLCASVPSGEFHKFRATDTFSEGVRPVVDAVVGRIEHELESIPDDGTTTSVRNYKDSIARDLSGALCLTLVN